MATMLAHLPAPTREYVPPAEALPTSTALASRISKEPPPYGSVERQRYIPRRPEDFGDGGAFPEIQVSRWLHLLSASSAAYLLDAHWHAGLMGSRAGCAEKCFYSVVPPAIAGLQPEPAVDCLLRLCYQVCLPTLPVMCLPSLTRMCSQVAAHRGFAFTSNLASTGHRYTLHPICRTLSIRLGKGRRRSVHELPFLMLCRRWEWAKKEGCALSIISIESLINFWRWLT